jgi:hypothetical protein
MRSSIDHALRRAPADRPGITVGTARSHLSRIFDKAGVTRQAKLVRLLVAEMKAGRRIRFPRRPSALKFSHSILPPLALSVMKACLISSPGPIEE